MKILHALLYFTATLGAAVYPVGAGKAYTTLGAVPWYTLAAGDRVDIYAISGGGCYAEKFLISTQGSDFNSGAITVQGINDTGSGAKPCITGLNAVQGTTSHDFRSGSVFAQYSEGLYVIGISLQAGVTYGPQYVILSNLEITGAAEGGSYTADDGSAQTYQQGVAGVRILNSSHVRIQNCYIHDIGGNGIFGKPNTDFQGTMADTQILYNHIGNNGVSGSFLYHNSYIESDRATYSGNLYDPEISGALGADLKDRSAGTVVSYNYFNGASARLVDLVEAQDGFSVFGSSSYYGYDFVYGNIFSMSYADVNLSSAGAAIHYGGDQGFPANYRNQTLSFYYNTFIFIADQSEDFKFSIFQPEISSQTIDVRNNIIAFLPHTSGTTPELDWSGNNNVAPTGAFVFGNNWVSPGWQMAYTFGAPFAGSSSGSSNLISPIGNPSPFVSASSGNFQLSYGSAARGSTSSLSTLSVSNPEGGNYTPVSMYLNPNSVSLRSTLSDMGALGETPISPAVCSGPCSVFK